MIAWTSLISVKLSLIILVFLLHMKLLEDI
jgi:hypothetical protein